MCTDGFSPYTYAIDAGLHDRADYSQVVKVYSKTEEGRERYGPGSFGTVEKTAILGNPNLAKASTSHCGANDSRGLRMRSQRSGIMFARH